MLFHKSYPNLYAFHTLLRKNQFFHTFLHIAIIIACGTVLLRVPSAVSLVLSYVYSLWQCGLFTYLLFIVSASCVCNCMKFGASKPIKILVMPFPNKDIKEQLIRNWPCIVKYKQTRALDGNGQVNAWEKHDLFSSIVHLWFNICFSKRNN